VNSVSDSGRWPPTADREVLAKVARSDCVTEFYRPPLAVIFAEEIHGLILSSMSRKIGYVIAD
jgi:hypothetical protein